MNRRRWLAVLLFSLAALGCAPKPTTPPPLREAYTLMDHGQNARAIELLEKELAENPGNNEARVLLASAYVGEAGLDIYKIYDSFQDILFSHPLWDTLSGKAKLTVPSPALDHLPKAASPSSTAKEAPVARAVDEMDTAFSYFETLLAFLDRFPVVAQDKWPLLDTALDTLGPEPLDRGISFYRVFIRIVYLKAYLGANLVGDPTVGTRDWVCQLDFTHLREHLVWVRDDLVAAQADFKIADPKAASSLVTDDTWINHFLADVDSVAPEAPAGSQTTLLALQNEVRGAFACE